MKKITFFSFTVLLLAFSACNQEQKERNGKIKLEFRPAKDRAVKISYAFSVHSPASNAVTNFYMQLSGKGTVAADGTVTLEMKNESIRMDGSIQDKPVSADAAAGDSLSGDAKLIAMPVFTLLGKTYRSAYDAEMNKRWEVQTESGRVVDSTENKMQLLLRYPDHEVGVGDSWKKNIMIKAGNKMSCDATYTLNEVRGDSAMISVEGKLSGKGESFGTEFSIDGNLKGSFTVDVATGWPLKTAIDQDFTLKIGGRDLPMKYTIKSEVH